MPLPLLQLLANLGANTDTLAGGELLTGTFKLFFVIGGLLYVAFSFIVIRQISIMRRTLITTFSPLVTLIGYVHLALAVLVTLYFTIVL